MLLNSLKSFLEGKLLVYGVFIVIENIWSSLERLQFIVHDIYFPENNFGNRHIRHFLGESFSFHFFIQSLHVQGHNSPGFLGFSY